MRHLGLRIVVALLAFAVGTATALLWKQFGAPVFEAKRQAPAVAPSVSSNAAPSQTETTADATAERNDACGCASAADDAQLSPPARPAGLIASGGMLNGKAISKPQPIYPPIAKAARAQGAVMVQVFVDERGCVSSARAVSGHPLLQASAVAAARKACFTPTRLSGQPVRVSGVLSYNFGL